MFSPSSSHAMKLEGPPATVMTFSDTIPAFRVIFSACNLFILMIIIYCQVCFGWLTSGVTCWTVEIRSFSVCFEVDFGFPMVEIFDQLLLRTCTFEGCVAAPLLCLLLVSAMCIMSGVTQLLSFPIVMVLLETFLFPFKFVAVKQLKCSFLYCFVNVQSYIVLSSQTFPSYPTDTDIHTFLPHQVGDYTDCAIK